jgi:hypothetical protein
MEPHVIITNVTYADPTRAGVKNFTATITHGVTDMQSSATILVKPFLAFPHTDADFRRELLHLGVALQAAAQSPQGISLSHREQQ